MARCAKLSWELSRSVNSSMYRISRELIDEANTRVNCIDGKIILYARDTLDFHSIFTDRLYVPSKFNIWDFVPPSDDRFTLNDILLVHSEG